MTDDKVTITLAAKTTDPNVLRLAAGDVGRMQLGFNGLPKSLPSTLNALADALDQAGDITYEPTRDHWTPYEPWMRDVLADDARVSWGQDGVRETRGLWCDIHVGSTIEMDPDRHNFRIHPDDTPERPTEDDPDEALAKVIYETYFREPGEWAAEHYAARESWQRAARAAREHIGHEVQMGNARLLADMRDRAEKAEAAMRAEVKDHDATRARAEKAGVGRVIEREGEWYGWYVELSEQMDEVAQDIRITAAERDKWQARHAALREDVSEKRWDNSVLGGDRGGYATVVLRGILDRDDERGGHDA